MSKPSGKELEILPLFRKRLEDLNLSEERKTDHYLLRWLRARELNPDQAEEMLRKSLKWRAENNVDSILSWQPPEFVTDNYPMDIVGVDHDNVPVVYIPFGRWDLKKLVDAGYRDELVRYFDLMFERTQAEGKGKFGRDGTPVTQFIAIADAAQLSMRTLMSFGVVEAILDVVRSFEANQPETLKAAYVINATKVFAFLFSLMKPLLSQRTFGKIQIYDTTESKWKPVLHEAIPKTQLPAVCGGTQLTEIDLSMGLSVLDLNDDDSSEGTRSLTVAAGKTYPLDVKVPEGGSILSWNFKTQENDIGFSVSYGDEKLVKNQRVDAHTKPVEGSVVCKSSGIYTITFDNSFSRFKSKLVKYRVSVRLPAM